MRRLHLITVIPSVADIDLELSASDRDRLLESMKSRGEELLAKAREQMKALGVSDGEHGPGNGALARAGDRILAEKEKIDLIVIGSRGRSANQRFLSAAWRRMWCATATLRVRGEGARAGYKELRTQGSGGNIGPLFLFRTGLRYNGAHEDPGQTLPRLRTLYPPSRSFSDFSRTKSFA